MRLLIDSLIALMLVVILGGVLIFHRHEQQHLLKQQQVQASMSGLHEQMLLQAALNEVEKGPSGKPLVILPRWFGKHLPVNVLVQQGQPWLDIAPPDDWSDHPPDPVIEGLDQAGFWYNPNRGIFRARVLPQLSEHRTLKLYNALNASALKILPKGQPADRRPLALTLTPNPPASEIESP